MIRTESVSQDFSELNEIRRLYLASFPKKERDSFHGLLHHSSKLDFRACFDGNTLIGLYSILSVGDLSHIQFLAVEEKYRDEGYGSQILNEIKSRYNGNRIIVDMEDPDEEAKNHLQRMKRAHFYKENGFVDDGIRYCWHDQNFSILIWNGKLDYDEFVYFWERYDDEPGTLSKLHMIH